MKRAGTLLATTLVLFPAFSHAATLAELQSQVQALMAQLAVLQTQGTTTAPPAGGATLWPNITRNLLRGMRGEDVASLQRFLISQNLLSADSATGFFGALTEAAVKKWQAKNNIVSSGTPNTTGFGAVGPRTRAALARAQRETISPQSSQPSPTPAPLTPPYTPRTTQPKSVGGGVSAAPTHAWQTGDWGACANSQQTRTVTCKDSSDATVPDSLCTATKPAMSQSCVLQPSVSEGYNLLKIHLSTGNCTEQGYFGPFPDASCTNDHRHVKFNLPAVPAYRLTVDAKKGDLFRVSGQVTTTNDGNAEALENEKALACAG